MAPEQSQKGSFYGLGIAPRILDVLTERRFVTPTPIQERAIPVGIEGKDLIGIAQTGTGKTMAFGIPMIQRLMGGKSKGLVVLPTRELAIQVDEVLRKIGGKLGLKTAVLIGGVSPRPQVDAIHRNPHIVIGTPGRIIDHLEGRSLTLSDVSILVLDEADRMLDMGFAPQLKKIFTHIPRERQTMLFSATMPDNIVRIATQHMKLPLRIEVAPPGTAPKHVEQEMFVVERDQKLNLLGNILGSQNGATLVFTRTKHGARKVAHMVRRMGHTAAEIHADRSLFQRREALEGFKSGKFRVLVATDIASRGIDVKGIELVINYDLPDDPNDYMHRIGRTARAGARGKAISFATRDQGRAVREIEKLMKTLIEISKLPDLKPLELKVVSEDPIPERSHFGRRPPFGKSPQSGRRPYRGGQSQGRFRGRR